MIICRHYNNLISSNCFVNKFPVYDKEKVSYKGSTSGLIVLSLSGLLALLASLRISLSNREFNILCCVSRLRISDALSINRDSDRETWEDSAFPQLPTCVSLWNWHSRFAGLELSLNIKGRFDEEPGTGRMRMKTAVVFFNFFNSWDASSSSLQI